MQVEVWKCKYAVLKNQLSIIFTATVRRIAGDTHLMTSKIEIRKNII